jgi:Na+-transporting NADH:ubiquinone oxidoreductase subunit NqrF
MENQTLLVFAFLVSGIGISTIIGFIANLWLKSITHEKDIKRLEDEVREVKEIEKQDFNELKKKNENIVYAIARLENLPEDVKLIQHDIKSILQLIRK